MGALRRTKLAELACGLIWLYQRLSPVLHAACTMLWGMQAGCRFEPSCSVLTQGALRRYGFWVGMKTGLNQIIRCHPWTAGLQTPSPRRGRHDKSCPGAPT